MSESRPSSRDKGKKLATYGLVCRVCVFALHTARGCSAEMSSGGRSEGGGGGGEGEREKTRWIMEAI